MEHCGQNGTDRALGELWERNFCRLAADHSLSFTPMQIGRTESAQAFLMNGPKWARYTLPDITVWTSPGQHHEIKHKDPTKHDSYGLEVYRFESLLWFANETGQDVMYTIHNHALSGGRNGTENHLEHWYTANVLDLNRRWAVECDGDSYVNGEKRRVRMYYWLTELWTPLLDYWRPPTGTEILVADSMSETEILIAEGWLDG